MVFELDHATARELRRTIARVHAGEAELAALARLERFEATIVDVERLAPLATITGLPWGDMFPELAEARRGRHVCCGCGGLCDSGHPCPMAYACSCRVRT